MKKILSVIMIPCLIYIIVLCLTIPFCKKLISTEKEDVEVMIVDGCYREEYFTPIWTGKSMVMQVCPAIYEITVEYDGIKYEIDGSETYNAYSDKVGETVIGTLEIRTYDDGSVRKNIVDLH